MGVKSPSPKSKVDVNEIGILHSAFCWRWHSGFRYLNININIDGINNKSTRPDANTYTGIVNTMPKAIPINNGMMRVHVHDTMRDTCITMMHDAERRPNRFQGTHPKAF
jgi:hypothetical protein